jgi:protocatechuate 3,4-dioxygenase alpha subunit
MKILAQTPSQTVGPFFAYGLTPFQYNYDFSTLSNHVLFGDFDGPKIKISGSVFDGQGNEIPDAIVEIWQAQDPEGNKSTENGFGRMGTGTEPKSRFVFETFKPNSQNDLPFISVIIFMRGLLIHTYTRIYFEDEAEANAKDSVFAQIPSERQKTLLAKKVAENEYHFDIHMQGPNETVFFEITD